MGKVEEQPTSPIKPSSYVILLLQIMSKRRTWGCVFVLVYGLLFTSSWNILKSMISWYKLQAESSSSFWWPALFASLLLGAVFGLLSMVAAFAVVVPAVLVTWIAIMVLMAFFGKSKRTSVVEGRKIIKEIFNFVVKVLLKEGNTVAAVLGYFVFGRTNGEGVD